MFDSLGAGIYTYIDIDTDSTHISNFRHTCQCKVFHVFNFLQQTFEHLIFPELGTHYLEFVIKRKVGAYPTLTIACTNTLHIVGAINYWVSII